jgi:hypothetical protein
MKRWLNEPLLHFIVLGALLFGAYAWLNPGGYGAGTVRITVDDIAWLKEATVRQMGREPTPEELRGLAAVFLKEELLGREARALGLDQNDLIVRRRLAQKVEFIVEDPSQLAEPTNDDLRRLYEANGKRYQAHASVSFTQVFFNPATRRDAAADAKAALAALSRGAATPGLLGDPFESGAKLRDADMPDVSGQFGREFADAVFALKPGAWQGPIASSYGLHLVRVTEAKAERRLAFSEVEPQLRERWREEHQREAYEQYLATLMRKYDVVMDEGLAPLIGPLNELAAHARRSQSNETGILD